MTKSQNRVNWDFLTKFPTTPASYCITDSLSHTTYVETNDAAKASRGRHKAPTTNTPLHGHQNGTFAAPAQLSQ